MLQILQKDSLKPHRTVYQELVNESSGGPHHAILTPRDQNQIRNFRKEVDRSNRLSHDAMFNTYHLSHQLKFNNRKGDPHEFIRKISVHPNVIVQMVGQPLIDELETVLKLSTEPVMIHYDTVFNMGDFYLSTLIFKHSMFKNCPVLPFGFLVHNRRYQEDHMQFMEVIRSSSSCLASKKVIIVTDREFDFSSVFPLAQQVFCWNHLERDLQYYLKQKANCNGVEISYFTNALKQLMQETTEEEFDDSWDEFKKEAHFKTKPVVRNYFEKNLLPVFKQSSSIWVLKSAGVSNPHNGITNNSSESMNAVLHRLQNWKQVPLDIICYSLYQMCCYYQREIIRGLHQCGSWELKDEFSFCQRDPSLMPFLPKVVDPQEIVARAKGDIFCNLNNEQSIDFVENENEDDNSGDQEKNRVPNSQLGLAYQAIQDKRVSIVKSGCWMVIGTDDTTPYAIRLFPKETCSCPAVNTCYHILACKIMIGQNVDPVSNPNITLMQQKIRRKKKERPSGRKAPRAKDYHPIQEINEGTAI